MTLEGRSDIHRFCILHMLKLNGQHQKDGSYPTIYYMRSSEHQMHIYHVWHVYSSVGRELGEICLLPV